MNDIYFTKDQVRAIINTFEVLESVSVIETFISVNKSMGRTYAKKGEELNNNNDGESTDILEIADAALASIACFSSEIYYKTNERK